MNSIINLPNIATRYLLIPLWHNSNIKIANKPVFIRSWYEKEVKVVQDFFDDCKFIDVDVF